MPKPTILISINTTANTESDAFGRSFIQSLCDEDTRLVPEYLSQSESYKDPFIGIDHFLANWWAMPMTMKIQGLPTSEYFDGPAWIRKSNLASRGYVNHGLLDIHYQRTPSRVWYECRWAKNVNFDHLFDAWVELFCPSAAMLHVFTEPEQGQLNTEEDSAFETGSFGGPAKPGIPNIGWAMAYGKGYAHEVDVARIRAAGFNVEERQDVVIIRVTEKLSDVINDFAYFSQRRAELKALFRPDLFWIKEEFRAEFRGHNTN